jgi:site-specific DNA-methyltransferase (adenine-specific)
VTDVIKKKSILSKEEWREYTKTVWQIANTTHEEHPAVFPVEIPHRLIKLFSWYGETVLDPFAGSGTTAKAAVPLGRKVICVDQSEKYANIIRRDCSELKNGRLTAKQLLQVVHGDSRDLSSVEDESVSLIVSSPPYWNKADYGKGSVNIGNVSGYRRFLEEIRPVFEECFRVLQPGRKCCLVTANVNQHTDHGLLTFPLAADFGVILREIGFVMVTEVIWSKDGTGGRWGSANAQRPIFGSYPYPPNFLFKNVHEYILVFSKPPSKKSKGPTVLPYDEIMATSSRLNDDNGT